MIRNAARSLPACRRLAQGFVLQMSGAASFRGSLARAKFKTVENGRWRVRIREPAGKRG